MGYRNVWEITIQTVTGNTLKRYIGKAREVDPYMRWLMLLDEVLKVTSRKLSDQERKVIPFYQIIG